MSLQVDTSGISMILRYKTSDYSMESMATMLEELKSCIMALGARFVTACGNMVLPMLLVGKTIKVTLILLHS